MNKMTMTFGAAGVVALLAGCGPELAQVQYGAEEARWQETLRANYSGYEAPRTAPPAIEDNVSPRLLEEERLRKGQEEEAPMTAGDDPAVVADKAEDKAPAEAKAADKEAKSADKEAKSADKEAKAADKEAKAADEKTVRAKEFEEYEVKYGDNLGIIAKKFYGDARRYDVIVKANPQLEANPNKLKVGMKLVIPKI